jgi:hypothetical protein
VTNVKGRLFQLASAFALYDTYTQAENKLCLRDNRVQIHLHTLTSTPSTSCMTLVLYLRQSSKVYYHLLPYSIEMVDNASQAQHLSILNQDIMSQAERDRAIQEVSLVC